MLRGRHLLYIGLFIYLLDLHQIGTDALGIFKKKKEEPEEEELSSYEKEKREFYKKAYQTESRETKSGEHLQYAFNPYCGWLEYKVFGPAGLQANCFFNNIIGVMKIYKKWKRIIKAFL